MTAVIDQENLETAPQLGQRASQLGVELLNAAGLVEQRHDDGELGRLDGNAGAGVEGGLWLGAALKHGAVRRIVSTGLGTLSPAPSTVKPGTHLRLRLPDGLAREAEQARARPE